MPYGQLVIGAPGSGKSTYCDGMLQFLGALGRPCVAVNLDPANENVSYKCALDINELITVKRAMEDHGLGPNGAMLYCMEVLEANLDWLERRLNEVIPKGGYVLFDIAGQVELSTNHSSLKNVLERLAKMTYRLVAVHMIDSHLLASPTSYISALLLSLRAMLQLELPHINVLTKIDLLQQYQSDMHFDLRYYTEVQDLDYLCGVLPAGKFSRLNKAICDLVTDFGLVSFETLCVEDKQSMMSLLRLLDRAVGYAYNPASSDEPNSSALFSVAASVVDWSDVGKVQERWGDSKEEYDAWEKRQWGDEWAERKNVQPTSVGPDSQQNAFPNVKGNVI